MFARSNPALSVVYHVLFHGVTRYANHSQITCVKNRKKVDLSHYAWEIATRFSQVGEGIFTSTTGVQTCVSSWWNPVRCNSKHSDNTASTFNGDMHFPLHVQLVFFKPESIPHSLYSVHIVVRLIWHEHLLVAWAIVDRPRSWECRFSRKNATNSQMCSGCCWDFTMLGIISLCSLVCLRMYLKLLLTLY